MGKKCIDTAEKCINVLESAFKLEKCINICKKVPLTTAQWVSKTDLLIMNIFGGGIM